MLTITTELPGMNHFIVCRTATGRDIRKFEHFVRTYGSFSSSESKGSPSLMLPQYRNFIPECKLTLMGIHPNTLSWTILHTCKMYPKITAVITKWVKNPLFAISAAIRNSNRPSNRKRPPYR